MQALVSILSELGFVSLLVLIKEAEVVLGGEEGADAVVVPVSLLNVSTSVSLAPSSEQNGSRVVSHVFSSQLIQRMCEYTVCNLHPAQCVRVPVCASWECAMC